MRNYPLLRKSLLDLRVQILGWGIGMGLMLAATVGLFPSISDLYGDMLSQLPDAWKAFIGNGDLSTIEGYLDTEFFSYAQIAFAIFAILAGSAAIIGEETAGTMDLLLSQPITRQRLAIAKLGGLAVATALIIGITSIGLFLPNLFMGEVSSYGRLINGFLLLIPFELAIAYAAAFLAQLFGSRIVGGSLVAGVLVASYMFDALSGMSSVLQDLRPIYLTSYFQGRDAVTGDISWTYLGASLAGLVVFAIANVVYFVRRDVAVGGAVSVRLPWRRHRPDPAEAAPAS